MEGIGETADAPHDIRGPDLTSNLNPHIVRALARGSILKNGGKLADDVVRREAIQTGRGNVHSGIVAALGAKR